MNIWKTLKKLSGGFVVVFSALLALVLSFGTVANAYRTNLDSLLGTVSYKTVTDTVAEGEDLYDYKPKVDKEAGIDATNVDGLMDYMHDVPELIGQEGTVLLKNSNATLPLNPKTQSVALIGTTAYQPYQGGEMGSKTDYTQAITLIQALKDKGFSINANYESLYNIFLDGDYDDYLQNEGGTGRNLGTTTTKGKYILNESNPTEVELSDTAIADVGIVLVGRLSGERHYFLPGEAGKGDPSEFDANTDILGLSKDELANIKFAQKNCSKVIVMINSDSAMDLPELNADKTQATANNYGVDAVMWVGHPGAFGFNGVVDVLRGYNDDNVKISPSGHLADTYAAKASNSPAMVNNGEYFFDYSGVTYDDSFTENDKKYNQWYMAQVEGIYTGYKYYETRYFDALMNTASNANGSAGATNGTSWSYEKEVVYPFGYGLSYTTFEEKLTEVTVDTTNRKVTATVTVKNTGTYNGKHAVQLYVQAPYTNGGLEKAAIQLIGFEKTQLLEPGQSKTIKITVDFVDFATYDDKLTHHNVVGAYVLDAGNYYFSVGNGSHDALKNVIEMQDATKTDGKLESAKLANISRIEITESEQGVRIKNQLQDMDPLNAFGTDQGLSYLSRSNWQTTWPKEHSTLKATEMMKAGLMHQVYTVKNNGNADDVVWGKDSSLKYTDLKPAAGEKIEYNDIRLQELVEQMTIEEAIQAVNGCHFRKITGIKSLDQPEPWWDDGPAGFDQSKLGNNRALATADQEYRAVDNETWKDYTLRPLPTQVMIASTFSQELVREAGEMMGSVAIWAGVSASHVGANIHRTPYNARNHEYYSEDPILTSLLMDSFVEGGSDYGFWIAPKHFAFNDTELNRAGIAPFMTEQKARETELRCYQKTFESGSAMYTMTAFNRVGAVYSSAHNGLMRGILRGEWNWNGYVITDVAGNVFANARDSVAASSDGILGFSTNVPTDANSIQVNTKESIGGDMYYQKCLQESVKRIEYMLINSNFMNGVNGSSRVVKLTTWYDTMLTSFTVVFAILASLSLISYVVLSFWTPKTKRNKA